ncbi:MAG: FxsA family protein [Mycobacteriaceae bacterium]|nr:FxsA family protein [Mycobacteriaceae bacterium]
MVLRWFLVYVVVELAAVIALVASIGAGWTVLLLLATLGAGTVLAGAQMKRQMRRLRAGFDTSRGALTDGALIALGTVLVVIPGVVTTALGVLLLLPPVRVVARPAVAALVARRAPLIAYRRPDYIDGEVIDVVDVEPAALPRSPS